jgi:hypothetical protein
MPKPSRLRRGWQHYLNWIRIHVRFDQATLEATVSHYLQEVEHVAERIDESFRSPASALR